MGATQRLAVPAPSASSPSLSGCAQTLYAHTKRREDDGHAVRAIARRASGALYALACVALAAWAASFLWEASAADALAGDSPLAGDDASLERWLEAHVVALGGDDARAEARDARKEGDARTGDGWGKRRARHDANENARAARRAPAPPLAAGSSSPAPPGPLPPLSGHLESIPMYAYRAALADRTSSNVLDVARLAAEDRRAFVRGETAAFATTFPFGSLSAGFAAERKERSERSDESAASRVVRVVATHHKTGTALMHDVFSAIARHQSGKRNNRYGAFADVRAMEDHPDAFSARARGTNARGAGVVLDYHLGKAVPDFVVDDEIAKPTRSFSPDAGLPFALTAGRADGRDAYRMVHVVRDPVEVLISGYLYHRRLPKDEQWLFRPAPGDVSGRSHAESLRSASPTQAMRAELRAADDELRMLVLAYRHVERDPDAINVKLESFFEDFDGAVAETLRFLRFDEEDIPGCVALARAFDTKRWSEEERSRNEHFTQREDRGAFRDAVFADPFLNKTTAYARYALEYADEWPEFD